MSLRIFNKIGLFRFKSTSGKYGIRLQSLGMVTKQCQSQIYRPYLRVAQLSRLNLKPSQVFTNRGINIDIQTKKTPLIPRHKWDKVPEDFSLVYQSSVRYYVGSYRIAFSALSFLSTSFVVVQWPQIVLKVSDFDIFVLSGIAGALILAAVLINNMARHFFTRIYFHEKSGCFIGVQRTFYGRLKQLKYTAEDVSSQPPEKGDKPLASAVMINGKRFYLSAKDFVSPTFYNLHCGGNEKLDLSKSYFEGPKF